MLHKFFRQIKKFLQFLYNIKTYILKNLKLNFEIKFLKTKHFLMASKFLCKHKNLKDF